MKLYLLVILSILFLNCSLIGKKDSKKLVNSICKSSNFSGSILIAFDNKIIINNAYGYSNKLKLKPNTLQTIYPIASLTKLFTKHALLYLVNKKKISLTNKVSDFIPHLMYVQKIKINHLLVHQSGLPDIHNRISKFDNPWMLNASIKPNDLINTINSFKTLDFEPGEKMQYSNSNYLLMAQIIEKVSEKSLEVFFNEIMFAPYQMNYTGLYKNNSRIKGHALGYSTQQGKLETTPNFNFYNFWGSGNAYSNTQDLFNYYLFSQQKLVPEIKDKLIQHSGLYRGYRSFYKVVPEIGLAIIILSNNSDFRQNELIDVILSYYTLELCKKNKALKTSNYKGTYIGYINKRKISIDINYQSNKYYCNGNELIFLNQNTFLISNKSLNKLEFIQKNNQTYYLKINDNGTIIKLQKIK